MSLFFRSTNVLAEWKDDLSSQAVADDTRINNPRIVLSRCAGGLSRSAPADCYKNEAISVE